LVTASSLGLRFGFAFFEFFATDTGAGAGAFAGGGGEAGSEQPCRPRTSSDTTVAASFRINMAPFDRERGMFAASPHDGEGSAAGAEKHATVASDGRAFFNTIIQDAPFVEEPCSLINWLMRARW
jgi:hypothetical protein